VFERAGVSFSHVFGDKLPPSASNSRPEIAGARSKPWVYPGVSSAKSLCTHHALQCPVPDRNPLVRPAPLVVRGGFDLTPYYPYDEDVLHWHRAALAACRPFGADVYGNTRTGAIVLFFAASNEHAASRPVLRRPERGGFERSFALTRSVGDHFLPAYRPILERRKDHSFGERERRFQLYRRGRYVESIWSTTAARCSACSRADAANRS